MKLDVNTLEKLGQTQSIHQFESAQQMIQTLGIQDQAFKSIKTQNKDLVCLILPDDDDEE